MCHKCAVKMIAKSKENAFLFVASFKSCVKESSTTSTITAYTRNLSPARILSIIHRQKAKIPNFVHRLFFYFVLFFFFLMLDVVKSCILFFPYFPSKIGDMLIFF